MTRIFSTPAHVPGFYGSFYDSSSAQSAASPNIGYPMRLNTTVETFGVTVNSSSISILNKGVYNFQFSTQFVGAKTANLNIWLKQNGIDVPWSNTTLTTSNQSSDIVAAWNFVQTFNANDVVQLMWATSDVAIQIQSASVIAGPQVPGVIVTVTQI